MNERLFIGFIALASIYFASRWIPRLAHRYHLLLVCLGTVALFSLVYVLGGAHLPASERLMRGLFNGGGVAIVGAALSILERRRNRS